MFTLFDIACYAIPVLAFTYFGGPQIVSDVAITKYRKFRKLNSFVAKQHKGIFTILWISIMLIFQAMFYTFSQWINKTVVKHDKFYEVTYFIKGNKYKMRIPSKDVSPSTVFLVSGDNDTDLTDEVEPYFGPYNNFHGIKITPATFNQNTITVEDIHGEAKTFSRDDPICIV